MSEPIEKQVRRTVSDVLDVPIESVGLKTRFVDDLGADSLAVEDILGALEEKLGVSIAPNEASELETVEDLIKHVEQKRGKRS